MQQMLSCKIRHEISIATSGPVFFFCSSAHGKIAVIAHMSADDPMRPSSTSCTMSVAIGQFTTCYQLQEIPEHFPQDNLYTYIYLPLPQEQYSRAIDVRKSSMIIPNINEYKSYTCTTLEIIYTHVVIVVSHRQICVRKLSMNIQPSGNYHHHKKNYTYGN